MQTPQGGRRYGCGMTKFLFAGSLLLLLNSVYLAAFASPTLFYYSNVLLHVGLGILLLPPAIISGVRYVRRGLPHQGRFWPLVVRLSFLSLLISMAAGLALILVGNLRPNRWILHLHIASAVFGVLLIAGYLRARAAQPQATPSLKRAWTFASVALSLTLVLLTTAFTMNAVLPVSAHQIVNPTMPPMQMEEEAMFGKDGPFFPSAAETTSRERIPSKIFLTSQTCGRSGCHQDISTQWSSSAHRFSSFNNQWYRKSIEYMQDAIGVKPSKWCAGCHDPALLFSGMMDTPIREIIETQEAQAGLGCLACHAIVLVKDTMGNGGYVIEEPPLHDLAVSDRPLLRTLHDFLVRLDPEPHRRTFLKPFHRRNAEFCSACHKVHLDQPINHYRWVRGFNEYDNWQASGVSGQGARSFYYPKAPRTCPECHMPLVPSRDAGNRNGFVHSHRFPGANTALPVANQDEEQLQETIRFLQNKQVSVDIFALVIDDDQGPPVKVDGDPSRVDSLRLSSTFAVGEEQGLQVSGGRAAPEKRLRVIAPLDRGEVAVRRGSSVLVEVVVRTRGVGHFFPGGTVDAFGVWLELKAEDERGRTIFWSGMVEDGGKGPVEKGAHFYRALLLDGHGNPINKRNAWAARSTLYVRLIPPGATDVAHFRLTVPKNSGHLIFLTAKLNYRKFAWWFNRFAFAGIRDPSDNSFALSPHYDDGRWIFEGDTSNVSGKIKGIPDLPIVTMAEAKATLKVVERDRPLLEINPPFKPEDRERWNDYGIGLLLQGNLKGAEEAFLRVTQRDPGYADGWVNVARARLQEGNIAGAKVMLEKALEVDPNLPKTHYFYALALKAEGQYDQALEYLRRVAKAYPRDRVVRNEIGRILFLQRRYREAIAELQEVLKIDPEDLQAHYNLMLSYRGAGDLEMARKEEELYRRFKADEASQAITGPRRLLNPEDNNERQPIHEHLSIPVFRGEGR